MHGFGGMGFGMGWGWIIGLIVIIVIIWLVVKSLNAGISDQSQRGKSAMDILKERYARGEINKEEFEQRKEDLK